MAPRVLTTEPQKHRRLIQIFLCFCVSVVIPVFLIVTSPSNLVAQEEKSSLKIGALLSLTGGLEQWCIYIRDGMEIAVEQDNESKIDFVFEDDRSMDRKAASTAASKLIDIDKVDLLFSWTASDAPVLIPIATRAKIPMVVSAYDHNVANGGSYIFGGFVNYDRVSREIARFFVDKRKAHTFGLVLAADDWSQSFEVPFRDEIKKLGLNVVWSETVASTETNLRPVLLKARDGKIDVLLAPLFADSLYSFLKQAHELHYNGLVHVGDGMFEEDIKIAGARAEGVYAAQIWTESPELKLLVKKKLGRELNALQLGLVAIGYDFVRHMRGVSGEIARTDGSISRESLREALGHYQSEGLLGHHMFGKPPVQSGEITMVVKDGHYVKAE